jgi:prevent-host-death family protein
MLAYPTTQTSITNIQLAKAQLSRLIDDAMMGKEVIIAKAGKPFVKLVPVHLPDRVPGIAKGKGALTPAFFEPLPEEELEAWGQ